MKKLTIKKIIEFRNKSDRGKKNFASNLKLNKPEPKPDGGGDYWISAVSAIARAVRENNGQIIRSKMKELEEKIGTTKHSSSKGMYKKNIEMLLKYSEFDFGKWLPKGKGSFLKNHRAILNFKDFQVETSPSHVFSFTRNEQVEIGAIWIIAKKDGYKKEELGMFTDILYRYLRNQYGQKYTLSSKYCIAVDAFKCSDLNYSQLEKAEIPALLNKTLDEIKKLM